MSANEDVVPALELWPAQEEIRELERTIGKQTVDVEVLRAAPVDGRRCRSSLWRHSTYR